MILTKERLPGWVRIKMTWFEQAVILQKKVNLYSFKNIAASIAMKIGPKPWINAPEEADVYIIDKLKRI